MVMSSETYPELIASRSELVAYLNHIWRQHFADTPRVNDVRIAYGKPWKSRLGLIRLSQDQSTSFIGVNALLQLPEVPEAVLITTIAHELVHYAHGFGSPLPRPYRHPHANRVVERELARRELGNYLHYCTEWIDKHWYSFYDMQRVSGWAGLTGIANTAGRAGKASVGGAASENPSRGC